MKEFKDLKFVYHNDGYTIGIKAILFFQNGYGISVTCDNYSYGNKDGLYEIGVLDTFGDLCCIPPITDDVNDVIGWLSEDDVSRVMREVQELPSAS